MMLIATLTISAIPPLSAFFSKDAIMSALYASGHIDIFLMALAASLLTAFYMFRMLFVLFFSKTYQEGARSSKTMIYPMAVLTFLSIVAGVLNFPEIFGGNLNMSHWLDLADKHIELSHGSELVLMSVNTLLIIGVIYYAYKRYAYTDMIEHENDAGFVANKFYIDEIYNVLIVKPLNVLSEFFDKKISHFLIDNSINNLAFSYAKFGKLFSYFENGSVRFYSLYILFGVVSVFIYLYWLLRAAL